MGLFKEKIDIEQLEVGIWELGLKQFEFLKEQFKDNNDIKENLLFILTELTNAVFIQNILELNKIKSSTNIVERINFYIHDSIQGREEQIIYMQYYVTLKSDLLNIVKEDKSYFYKVADYFMSEITEDTNKDPSIRAYLSVVLEGWYNIILDTYKNIKIIE